MDKERIFEEIIEAVKNEIPQALRDDVKVEMREVIKTNDEKLHGINLLPPPEIILCGNMHLLKNFKPALGDYRILLHF